MTRSENDTWDPATSVGVTATVAATARAMAGRGPNPLVTDEFAEPLVRAVGIDFFVRILDGEIAPSDVDHDATFNLRRLTEGLAIRTRFVDDFFIDATEAGIRQAVILASGLDSRPYRLVWPRGTTVYEIDQPAVIDFKTRALAGLGAEPIVERRTVAIDLRDDWPNALRERGFDPQQPTAWAAEGLLMYLPAGAQDRLFDDVTALSAPHSRMATEHYPDVSGVLRARAKSLTSQWGTHGFPVDMSELFDRGERSNPVDYLAALGWNVAGHPWVDLAVSYGLRSPGAAAPADDVVFLNAALR